LRGSGRDYQLDPGNNPLQYDYHNQMRRADAPRCAWAAYLSSKGGIVAHQRPHSVMDNTVTGGVGYCDNTPFFRLAFILFSFSRSLSVVGGDIGSKVLGALNLRNPLRILGVKTEDGFPVHPIHFTRGREGTTKWLNQKAGKAGCLNQKLGKAGCLNQKVREVG
jgi:hypothetical protein